MFFFVQFSSSLIGWHWHALTHLDDPSGIMCGVCVYTHLRWWISQPARFGPRNRVWSGMKHLEEEPERDGHLSNPWRSDSPRLLFPSLSLLPSDSGRFLFIFFQREKCQPVESRGPGSGSVPQYFPMIDDAYSCRVSPVIVFLKNSYGCRWLPSHPPALATWCSLAFFCLSLSRCFLCQAFDVIGKASAGKKREVLIH